MLPVPLHSVAVPPEVTYVAVRWTEKTVLPTVTGRAGHSPFGMSRARMPRASSM